MCPQWYLQPEAGAPVMHEAIIGAQKNGGQVVVVGRVKGPVKKPHNLLTCRGMYYVNPPVNLSRLFDLETWPGPVRVGGIFLGVLFLDTSLMGKLIRSIEKRHEVAAKATYFNLTGSDSPAHKHTK